MNYSLMKPHHIQQMFWDGSTIASTLMVLNSISIKPIYHNQGSPNVIGTLTQKDFYALIKKNDYLYNWFLKTYGIDHPDTPKHFINLNDFSKYVNYLFDDLKIPAKISRRYRKSTSYEKFLSDMRMCDVSNCTYMIIDIGDSYAPFGKLLDDVEFMVLDPDWHGVYGDEYNYDEGDGEYILPCEEFYQEWNMGSGYLLIDIY